MLRHAPETIHIQLDGQGWTDVKILIQNAKANNIQITTEMLQEVVAENEKQRFAFNEDGSKIRANQGHSVTVDLGYSPAIPPDILYHGTATHFLNSIYEKGLIKGKRHHVHLSADKETATKVGKRHGKLAIFEVHAKEMHEEGYLFYQSENGVWLTDNVPPKFLTLFSP